RRHSRSSSDGSGRRAAKEAAGTTGRPERQRAKGRLSCGGQRGEDAAQAQDRLRRGLDAVRRSHQHIQRSECALLETERFPDAALDAVALTRPGRMLARDQQTQARRARITTFQIERVTGHLYSPAFTQQAFKLPFFPQAAGRAEPEALAVRG